MSQQTSWKIVSDYVDVIAKRYPHIIDYRVPGGKWQDPGQAVCAEMYGPDWSTSNEFAIDNQREFPRPEIVEAARRVAEDETPAWMNPSERASDEQARV